MSASVHGQNVNQTHTSLHDPSVHPAYSSPDPFAPRNQPGRTSVLNAILATALFRCWHLLIFFGAWSTAVSIISKNVYSLTIQPTLLTVIGTVLGFVISYRTTSSFERYNEGRRLWSQVILASRTFARTTWFHVPNTMPVESMPTEEQQARSMVEKKSIVNLLEAFSVALKHYLRGEDGIYYQDLYHLVKFLPAYALPAGRPSVQDLHDPAEFANEGSRSSDDTEKGDEKDTLPPLRKVVSGNSQPQRRTSGNLETRRSSLTSQYNHRRPSLTVRSPSMSDSYLPMHNATSPGLAKKTSFLEPPRSPGARASMSTHTGRYNPSMKPGFEEDADFLLPAYMPPKYHIFDLFPFSLVVRFLTKRGNEQLKGKKAARLRAKMRKQMVSHNLPLEISLYLSSYVSALQMRKQTDVPTINTLIFSLNQLVDSLTGLERILTTPIPFSYSIHLWVVTVGYCLALPFQILAPLGWLTIPATVIASFVFFGFLVAGEEIENPFGYDKNDLNLDHFTHNIIRNELRAITSSPPPQPSIWAFVPDNDLLFATSTGPGQQRMTPEDWVKKGPQEMELAMAMGV